MKWLLKIIAAIALLVGFFVLLDRLVFGWKKPPKF